MRGRSVTHRLVCFLAWKTGDHSVGRITEYGLVNHSYHCTDWVQTTDYRLQTTVTISTVGIALYRPQYGGTRETTRPWVK